MADSKVPNIDDIARWFGQPSETHVTGVYEGGSEMSAPEYDYKQHLDYKLMPKARVYKVGISYRRGQRHGYNACSSVTSFAQSSSKGSPLGLT